MNTAKAAMWAILFFGISIPAYFMYKSVNPDPMYTLNTAMGDLKDDGTLTYQIAIGMVMASRDEVFYTPGEKPDWDRWMRDHFKLTGANGDQPKFKKLGTTSTLIDFNDLATVEFIISTTIQQDQDYTLIYEPVLGEPEKWEYTFTPEDRGFRRVNMFEPK